MFIDNAFPDVTSIKNIKRVGRLHMDGWTLKEKTFMGESTSKGGLKLQEFLGISQMLLTPVHLMGKNETNFRD